MDDAVQEDLERLSERERPARTLGVDTLRAPVTVLETRPAITLGENATVQVAVELMNSAHIGAVLVVDADGRLSGIFTERDVIRRVLPRREDLGTMPLSRFMTPHPDAVRTHDMVAYAMHYMHIGGYRHVPVVDDDHRPVTVVSVKDVVSYLADFFPEEVCNLPPDPASPVTLSQDGG